MGDLGGHSHPLLGDKLSLLRLTAVATPERFTGAYRTTGSSPFPEVLLASLGLQYHNVAAPVGCRLPGSDVRCTARPALGMSFTCHWTSAHFLWNGRSPRLPT